jgi:hypothetical protein
MTASVIPARKTVPITNPDSAIAYYLAVQAAKARKQQKVPA